MKSVSLCIAVLLALIGGVSALPRHYHLKQRGYRQLELVDVGHSHKGAGNSTVVTGSYDKALMQTGWNVLKVNSSASFSNEDQAYAAGYFEGLLTAQEAENYYINFYTYQEPNPPPIDAYYKAHVAWVEEQVAAKNQTSDYWYQVGLMWLQFHGLLDGFNAASANVTNGTTWTTDKLLMIVSMGDLADLDMYYNVTPGVMAKSRFPRNWRNMNKIQFEEWVMAQSHCSALFKVTDDLEEIYFGHDSWFYYMGTLRIFKHMTLNYQGHGTTAKTISMSSYPGALTSFDDYYITDSGLVAIETSMTVYNFSLYDGNIYPQSLLYWERTMVSNRMAKSAQDWATLIAFHNSGTYNNQWMILDLNLFSPGQPLPPNTFWLAEQMPGVVATRDATTILSYGYFPSYNVPLNRTLYDLAGYPEVVKREGAQMNGYQNNIRGEMFRRDQGKVKDLDSFKFMMQYNDYEQDPLSQGNPGHAIAARGDLDPTYPMCFGAMDSKVGSYSLWKQGMVTHAFNGPTPQQPMFAFNQTYPNIQFCTPHRGVPEVFNFKFEEMKP